jgi:hypothetical protein
MRRAALTEHSSDGGHQITRLVAAMAPHDFRPFVARLRASFSFA